MQEWMLQKLVSSRQTELEQAAIASGLGANRKGAALSAVEHAVMVTDRPRRRKVVSLYLGNALIAAGRRLAGPDNGVSGALHT